MTPETTLVGIRSIHTLVWAVFAASILLIPVMAHLGAFAWAACLIGFVFLEVLVLLVNRMRCPLTDVAARYTPDRNDNFDIYLPLWLARHNKTIFGTLYAVGVAYTLLLWSELLG